MSDLMLGMSPDLIHRRIAFFREAFHQLHDAYERSGRSDTSMLVDAEANYFFIVDHQARLFMLEQSLSYDDCLLNPMTRQITGFNNAAIDQEFELWRYKY